MIIFRQHDYAKKDYEGLSSIGKSRLRTGRDELAKGLRIERKLNNFEGFGNIDHRNFLHDNRLALTKVEKNNLLDKVKRTDVKVNSGKLSKFVKKVLKKAI